MSYQESKSKNYGVNSCEGCLAKQQVIDRRFEEIGRLEMSAEFMISSAKESEGFITRLDAKFARRAARLSAGGLEMLWRESLRAMN